MEKVITAIEAQKRNRQRVNVSLDGEFAFSLDRLTAAWLKPGRKLTAEEINRAILDLPVTVLENLGLGDTASQVKKVQDSTIGAIYTLIRDINHKVADLAEDLLEQKKSTRK